MPVRKLADWLGCLFATGLAAARSGIYCNPFSARIRNDPYSLYARLREESPFHYCPLIDGFLISRYADIVSILRDSRFTSDVRAARLFSLPHSKRLRAVCPTSKLTAETPPIIRRQGPRHEHLRRLAGGALRTPGDGAEGALPAFVERTSRELLNGISAGEEVELLSGFARPLARRMVTRLLGIPQADYSRVEAWLTGGLIVTFGGQFLMAYQLGGPRHYERAYRTRREMRDYFARLLQHGRSRLAAGLMSRLLEAEDEGRLTREETLAVSEEILVAGYETTAHQLGNCLDLLNTHPELFDLLRERPDRIAPAVEELCRYEPAIHGTSRIALEPVAFDGRIVQAGRQVVVLIGSANHDDAQFADPGRCDIDRQPNRHLTFGLGEHACIGAPTARLTLQTALRAMVDRFSSIHPGNTNRRWVRDPVVRGGERLLVRLCR